MSAYSDIPNEITAEGELNSTINPLPMLSVAANLSATFGIQSRVHDNLLYMEKYVGDESVPQDIKRLRRQVYDMMRRMGQPVIIKKMLTIDDVNNNYAERSANYDTVYGQTRNNDNLSWGTGFVSKEKSDNEYIDGNGNIVTECPDYASFSKAPKYRGFGPGIVTYVIEPDAAEDFFKLTPTGAMIQVQTADVTMGWFPKVSDNDLIINVELDDNGHVASTGRRYQAKMMNPISIRGLDRKGRREYKGDLGNRHVVNQMYPITLIPANNVLMQVETDR